MIKRIAAALLLLLLTAACSLTTPEEAPLIITATSPATSTPRPTATTVPQLATRPPTNTPFPTVAACITRDDWFAYTVSAGDTLAGIALRAGVSTDALALANCLEPDTTLNADEGVRVPFAILPPAEPTVNPDCEQQWLFTFRVGESEVTVACPDPLLVLESVGQDFEGGRMLRYPPIPGADSSLATIYVIYNNGFWEAYPDTWESSQPAIDESITVPFHRVQPAEGFGKIWRENQGVRDALGWAYAAPIPFSGMVQFPRGRTSYWYMDYGSARLALRLTRSDVAPNPWEIVGEY